jgi:carbamoyl-phosphate synthase small subunit
MTYPLIGNYGICFEDMESQSWPGAFIVREFSRLPSNFRSETTIQKFLEEQIYPGYKGLIPGH